MVCAWLYSLLGCRSNCVGGGVWLWCGGGCGSVGAMVMPWQGGVYEPGISVG